MGLQKAVHSPRSWARISMHFAPKSCAPRTLLPTTVHAPLNAGGTDARVQFANRCMCV